MSRLSSRFLLAKQTEWLIVLCVIPVLSWGGDNSSQTVRRWLDRIAEANQRYSYQATFVYHCDKQLSALKLLHLGDEHLPRGKLTSLTGPQRELIQNSSVFGSTFGGDGHPNMGRNAVPGVVPGAVASSSAIDEYYTSVMHRSDRIAGRETDVVSISPRDHYRYGFRLWLDRETGLPLRSDMLDSAGELVEQTMFTSIEFMSKEAASAQFDTPISAAVERATDSPGTAAAEAAAGSPVAWRVARAPAGFSVVERVVHSESPTHPHANEQLVLSDGLASVSVFIESAANPRRSFLGKTHRGAVNAFGTVVDGRQVTVVGEVPVATVEMIGQSIVQVH